jgi:NAD(P)-dependent dehydrogenase (short-subunit alcohol dehydrogenase family)
MKHLIEPESRQRVLVTAGASGIGAAIAAVFVRSGAHVHVCDIDGAALDRICAANPGMTGSVADVSNPAQIRQLGHAVDDAMGGLDVLVNNAGIGGPRKAVEDIAEDEWDQVLRVNVTGAFLAIRQFVPAMKQQRAGCIINISTTSVRTGLPLRTPYVVSKAALDGMTRNLARELGPFNIRCNAILPGSIENERGRTLMKQAAERAGVSYEEALERRLQFISMRSRILPEEIGDTALFLASPAARHVTGQFLSVCGNVEWEG